MSGNVRVEPLSVIRERSTENKWYSIPKRYIQAVLGFCVLFIVFWMRTSFVCTIFNPAEESNIHWTYEEIDLIDSAFTWGFTAAQIPGALLALKFSSHRVLLISVILTAILHAIVPFSLSGSSLYVVIVNLLQGIVEGPLYSACIGIWKYWAPPSERSALLCIVLCGSFFGLLTGVPLNVKLVSAFGGKASFFVSSAAALIWCLVWAQQMYESPSSHPFISQYELSYLEENIDVDNKLEITVKSVPWKAMLSSLPVWAVFLACICYFFTEYVFLTPYIYIIDLEIEKTHALLAIVLPNVILGVLILASGFFSDRLINTGKLSRTLVRKLFCCGAFTLVGVTLLFVRYYKNAEAAVICVNLAHGFLGLSIAGFWLNCLDFSPYYAPVMMGLCQTVGNFCGIIAPVILNAIGIGIAWHPLYLLDAFITTSFIVSLAYGFFGSGDVQSWGKPETMCTHSTEDELLRATYYSYPDGADCVVLVGDSQQLSDVYMESEK